MVVVNDCLLVNRLADCRPTARRSQSVHPYSAPDSTIVPFRQFNLYDIGPESYLFGTPLLVFKTGDLSDSMASERADGLWGPDWMVGP